MQQKPRFDNLLGIQCCHLLPTEIIYSDKDGKPTKYACTCISCGRENIEVSHEDLVNYTIRSCGCVEHSDIIGGRFGLWTVLSYAPKDPALPYNKRFICRCDCGTIKSIAYSELTWQHSMSCGCLRKDDIVGKTFGRLQVLKEVEGKIIDGNPHVYECRCLCGNPNHVYQTYTKLVRGRARSCGCLKCGRKYFSEEDRQLANRLKRIINRCYNPADNCYFNYGARGVRVYDGWLKDTFSFINWAKENNFSPNLSIDRVNPPPFDKLQNGPYAPWNCQWTTDQRQANNRRSNTWVTVNNEMHTIADWSRLSGVSAEYLFKLYHGGKRELLERRIERGINVQKVINLMRKRIKENKEQQTETKEEPSMFSIGEGVDIPKPTYTVNFNTDSIFDLLTGSVVRGYDGKWYTNGGIAGGSLSGICGRSNMFKSTFAASLMMRAAAIYDTQVYIADSEDSISRSLERICRFGGNHASKLNPDYIVSMDATTEYDLSKLLQTIREIGEQKLKHEKECTITTPFLNPQTGERVKALRPTIMLVDSLTECHGTAEDTMISNLSLDDAKVKTAYMLDANNKTLFLRQAKRYAAQYGIEMILTAHYGQKLNLDSYTPQPKLLQWASQNEAAKGTGSKFIFLTAVHSLINSCVKLMDDAKECRYRLNGQTSPTDLSEILVLMQRCKNNASGLTHPFVVSQENGLLTEVSDYHYLRSNKGYAMLGNNVTHQSVFLPEVNMTRNSFRATCAKDPRLIRALQLSAQWLYIQKNWSSSGWEFPLQPDPKQLVDVLMSDKNRYSIDRVLNSRGYWLPDELITKDSPEYMSIFDILEFFGKSGMIKS